MPIILPKGLASAALLRSEGVEVLHKRPGLGSFVRIGFINLMPDMVRTEVQFARLLGAGGLVVELVPILPPSYRVGHKAAEHYTRWENKSLPFRLDGLIVTGAPLEHLPFEDVTYWRELVSIGNWAARNVDSTLYICWAAFAALYMFHGVPPRVLPRKVSGVFQQHVMKTADPLTAGLGPSFPCPVSRYAEVEGRKVPWSRGLDLLAQSEESGLCLIADAPRNAYYMFNHLEYEADTLKLEYLRDCMRRPGVTVPRNYLPNGDVSQTPPHVWRRPAEVLFANWRSLLLTRACAGGGVNSSAA